MHRRTLRAFLLAPLVPGILLGICLGVVDLISFGGLLIGGHRAASRLLVLTLGPVLMGIEFGVLLGYPMAVLMGVPLHYFLSACRLHGRLAYSVLGSMLGVLAWIALYLASRGAAAGNLAHPGLIGLLAACGTVAGFSFWLIARPDQQADG